MLQCKMSPNKGDTTVLHSHSAFFDHSADVIQVITEASHRQTQHLNLCLCPLCPGDGKKKRHTGTREWKCHSQTKTPDNETTTRAKCTAAECAVTLHASPRRAGVRHWVQLHGQLSKFGESSSSCWEDLTHLQEEAHFETDRLRNQVIRTLNTLTMICIFKSSITAQGYQWILK